MSMLQRLAQTVARWTTPQKAVAGAITAAVVLGGAVGGVVATSGSSGHVASSAPVSTPPPSPSPRPKPTHTTKPKPKPKPKPQPAINPLTGLGRPPTGPVLAVKIDDTANGRPQRGIDQADIVYIEQAEGGLTRLVAVFGTHKPQVEPVRSVRASDPELLTQYGPIGLVASGGGGDSLQYLGRSILHGVINDGGGPGFSRDGGREVPYNLMSDLQQVSSAIHAGGAKSIGFAWSKTLPLRAFRPMAPQIHTVVGGTGVSFQWSARLHRYVRIIDGVGQTAASGAPIATPNVIVQYCRVTVNRGDVDVAGNPSQYTHSIGHGKAVVFRDGRRIDGSWIRPNARSGTTLRDGHNRPITLAPGGAWVVLVADGAPLTS